MKRVFVTFCFLVIFIQGKLWAQNDCETSLQAAKSLFDEGYLDGIDSLILPCLENDGFTPEHKAEAYKLLTVVHIFEDERDTAEVFMQRFLQTNPEYVLSTTDHQEFVDLYNEFRTDPIFSIGIIAGGNWTYPRIIQDNQYGVHTLNPSNDYYSPGNVGIQVGLRVSKNLTSHWLIDFDVMYKRMSYVYNESFFEESSYQYGTINFTTLTVDEDQEWLNIPIKAVYNMFPDARVSPFFGGGFAIGYLASVTTELTRDYNINSFNQLADVEGTITSLYAHRRKLNLWLMADAGLYFTVPRGTIAVGAKYSLSGFNQLKSNAKYLNQELMYEYFYQEDDLLLDNLEVYVSYTYKIYKPVIKKKK